MKIIVTTKNGITVSGELARISDTSITIRRNGLSVAMVENLRILESATISNIADKWYTRLSMKHVREYQFEV